MKKVLCLALCMLLCLIACAAFADTEYEEGCFRFSINEEAGQATVLRLLENYAVVKVPDTVNGYPVTAIGNHAFYNAQRLEKVYLPAAVTSIGDYAFAGCPVLETVQMPGVTVIGEGAFSACGLHKIELPNGLTTVGKRAFAECQSLYSAKLPGTLAVVPEEMFTGCKFLNAVVLPEGITTLGDKAFCSCGFTDVSLPMSLTELGVNPFINCVNLKNIQVSGQHPALYVDKGGLISKADARLVSYAAGLKACGYTVPADVLTVGDAAFSQSLNLKEIVVSEGVETIGDYAFWYCTSLTNVTIADSVTTLKPTAFAECYHLVNLALPQGIEPPVVPVDPML